jgi:hypothetical protein
VVLTPASPREFESEEMHGALVASGGAPKLFCDIGTVLWIESSSMRRKSDLVEMNDSKSALGALLGTGMLVLSTATGSAVIACSGSVLLAYAGTVRIPP